jgi:hypothetical protein
VTEPFENRWQKLVCDLLLTNGKINEDLVDQMTTWRHSDLSVHHGVRLDAGDTAGLQRLGQHLLRCPLGLQRLIKVTDQGQVLYLAEKPACRRSPPPAQTSPAAWPAGGDAAAAPRGGGSRRSSTGSRCRCATARPPPEG